MAEAFGIAAGAVGVAAAFTACVDCFEYIQLGRHFGRDYQTDLLSLNCARLRLTRWGQAVNISEDPKLGRPEATSAEIQTVKDSLLQVLALFADSENISKRYRLNAKAGDDLSTLSTSDLDPAVMLLNNKMKALATERQKRSSILKTASWALYHRSELRELISGITSLIDNVERLFPAQENQLALAKQEAAEIQDTHALELVEKTAQEVDKKLCAAAREARTGHQYLNVTIKGKAQLGDSIGSDWKGEVVGPSHTYGGVHVDEVGKASIGNKYGGKDFWDD